MKNINNKSLHQKLGIKEGFEVKLINEPDNYIELLNGIASQIHFHNKLKEPVDVIHLFTKSKNELLIEFPFLKDFIRTNGMLWISWPKRNSKYVSDLSENIIREIGLTNGLVDTKVCSVDDDWSALKFIHRAKERK